MIAFAVRLGAVLSLSCACSVASAQARDWIDTFPSVTTVAHAAFEELKVSSAMSKVKFTGDDDSIALNLAATLVILRGIMLLKYNQEEDMAPEREEKLRTLAASYLEAELAIGQGAATRKGYIKADPSVGRGCAETDLVCYRRWWANDILNIIGRAEYRERILERLFPCEGLGKAYYDLRQTQGIRMPHLPSPSTTLQIAEEIAGVAPPGCDIYGGDSDRDGMCYAWEPTPAAFAAPAVAPKCEPLRLLQVKSDAAGGLVVAIANHTTMPGERLTFRVLRSAPASANKSPREIWSGEATVQRAPPMIGHPVATIAQGAPLAIDPAEPFLIVEATGKSSQGPVQCEQPITQWFDHHLNPPAGLHGPYANVEAAVKTAGDIARQLTKNVEFGFVVVRDRRQAAGHYYATAPVRSSHVAGTVNSQPLVLPEDFYASFDAALRPSCMKADDVELAAIVHTHPDTWLTPDNFSMQDFNQAIGFIPIRSPMWFGPGMRINSKFEKTVLITVDDGCVRTFVPQQGDEIFTKPELWLDSAAVVLQTYRDYTDRVTKVMCYK